MKLRVACFLTVWACAFLTSGVMAAPWGSSSNSEESDALDEASLMAFELQTLLDALRQTPTINDDSSDEDEDDTFTRRRRVLGGIHSRYPGSGRRFRNRPRVFIPRRRPGSKAGSRNNVSPY